MATKPSIQSSPSNPGGLGPADVPLPHLDARGEGVGGEGLRARRLPQQAAQVGAGLLISTLITNHMENLETLTPGAETSS